MINNRHIAMLFAGLSIFSLIAVIITFVVWNKPEKLSFGVDDIVLNDVKGNVEKCNMNDSLLYAKGWIFSTNNYKGVYKGNTYVAINENGTLYKVKTVREDRPDVTTYFKEKKKKYDLSGYSASSRFGLFGVEPSREIFIITEHEGVRGMKYACK